MKKLVLLLTALVLLAGCAPSIGEKEGDARAGFWWGLWHGMISPFVFIASIFNSSVCIYESLNHRVWYDLGFVIGIGGWGGGAAASK